MSVVRLSVVTIIILVEAIGLVFYLGGLSLPQSLSFPSSRVATKEATYGNRLASVSDNGRATEDPSRPTLIVADGTFEEQKQVSRPDAFATASESTNISIKVDNPKIPVPATAGVPENGIIASASTAAITSQGNNYTHVLSWDGVSELSSIITRCWTGKFLCEEVRAARRQFNNSQLHVTVKISVSCQEFYSTGNLGTGNFLSAFYRMRLSALVLGNVDIHLTCPDADQIKSQLVLPWFMGHYWASEHMQQLAENYHMRNLQKSCDNSVSVMYRLMRYDLRRMAIGLVGLPVKDPSHPAHKWAEEYLWSPSTNVPGSDRQLSLPLKDDTPPFPAESLELDDATIHFRCGGAFLFLFCFGTVCAFTQ